MPHVTRYFKALSDDTRLRLVHVLCRYELSVNELVTLMEMGQSRVSRHLKVLAEAGLVTSRRDGLWVFYAAVTEGEGHAFLQAVTPFLTANMDMRADMDMAGRMLEDRALKTRQFFNAVADHWDSLNHEVLGGFDLPSAVAELVPTPCDTAVDLGCGTGLVLESLRHRVRTLIGVDGSSRMLELARRRFAAGSPVDLSVDARINSPLDSAEKSDTTVFAAADVSLRMGELDHLPLRDDEADFVCLNLVLHHLSHPATTVEETRRVLRPGGLMLITDFDRHTQERMRTDYGDRWLGFDEATLRKLVEQAGFVVEYFFRQPLEQQLGLHFLLARKIR